MADEVEKPDVKRVLAAMMFGAKSPLTIGDIRRVFGKLAAEGPEETRDMARLRESEIREALGALQQDFAANRVGIHVAETSSGFRFETDSACGPFWPAPTVNSTCWPSSSTLKPVISMFV